MSQKLDRFRVAFERFELLFFALIGFVAVLVTPYAIWRTWTNGYEWLSVVGIVVLAAAAVGLVTFLVTRRLHLYEILALLFAIGFVLATLLAFPQSA